MAVTIATIGLIISDTHGGEYPSPDAQVDGYVHCGDLTEESKIGEFRDAYNLLKGINAPLKLVIAGNHDFMMDIPTFKQKLAAINPPLEEELIRQEYGDFGEVKALFTSSEATAARIVFLDETIHSFTLANGAHLTVYARPFTPGTSESGFQYPQQERHKWDIRENTDTAIIHSPPRGVLDYTDTKQRAGSPELFSAVAKARPLVHCFGHIHESWGAKQVAWRMMNDDAVEITHFTAIDNDKSTVIETLGGIRPRKFDNEQTLTEKREKLERYTQQGFVSATDTVRPPKRGEETLRQRSARRLRRASATVVVGRGNRVANGGAMQQDVKEGRRGRRRRYSKNESALHMTFSFRYSPQCQREG